VGEVHVSVLYHTVGFLLDAILCPVLTNQHAQLGPFVAMTSGNQEEMIGLRSKNVTQTQRIRGRTGTRMQRAHLKLSHNPRSLSVFPGIGH
jgi:hypothetical protein